MTVQIAVEVTDELFPTQNGGKMQAAYVDTGSKYPEQVKLFCRDDKVLQPGHYVATSFRKKGFDFVLDLNKLTPRGK